MSLQRKCALFVLQINRKTSAFMPEERGSVVDVGDLSSVPSSATMPCMALGSYTIAHCSTDGETETDRTVLHYLPCVL